MTLPAPLKPVLDIGWATLARHAGDRGLSELKRLLDEKRLTAEFERLLACSQFFVEQAGREFDWLLGQLRADTLLVGREWDGSDWDAAVAAAIPGDADEKAFMSALRRLRQREMLRLIWRDFSRRAALETTLADISAFADACLRRAVIFATDALTERWGTPIGEDSGDTQSLVVLAMGKLGGRELNLSSDIDLIFAYPEAGETSGGRSSVSNQEYFIKLGQLVIRLLDSKTVDGFVFRVDMRLRPYGDSGALVGSYAALELYYQEQGRDWERYAMIKARPVTGDARAHTMLSAMIRSFVFRRYTDFSVIDSLRDMKALIVAEARRAGVHDDIKRGPGGIREIEFMVQSLQLIHGGRMPALQHRELDRTLNELLAAELMSVAAVSELRSAYRFLRNLEHALQGMADQQTQKLPNDGLSQWQLAVIMGLPDWAALTAELAGLREGVSAQFDRLVATPSQLVDSLSEQPPTFAGIDAGWLASRGFATPEASLGAINELIESTRVRSLAGESRLRLERFLPRLIEAARVADDPDAALIACLPFVAAVCRRSAYLVLLEENPHALGALVDLSTRSSWIAEKLAARPELVDELLRPDRLHTAPDRSEMRALVQQQLLRVPEDDLEEQMITLGRIKDAVILRVAASELVGALPTMKVSDNLTFLAEVLIEQAVHLARAELVRRYGEPEAGASGFAVLGYGKLGGIELSYGSDLDLVFVYRDGGGQTSGPRVIDSVRFYNRLAQRVVHVLSTAMLCGRLYEVDLRLRPNGDSGLVTVSLAALARYQRESAWTWEHQALVRARPICGESSLMNDLGSLRAEILAQTREPAALATEVIGMRRKMLAHLPPRGKVDGEFDLKRASGGIVDIEFVVQYLVLAHASRCPEISAWSDVVRLLASLERAGIVSEDHADRLCEAYLAFRSGIHLAALQGRSATGLEVDYAGHRQAVRAIGHHYLPGLFDEQHAG